MIRRGLALSLMLALGACAGSPAASPQEDALAKRFDRPEPERGALYVYRSGLYGIARPLAPNKTAADRTRNRRVDFTIVEP